jgi:hypothetical protein
MKAIVIRIDDEYLPAVAKDYKAAIRFLIDKGWIDEETEIWIDEEDKYITIQEAGIRLEDIKNYNRDTFEKYFGYDYELVDRELVE